MKRGKAESLMVQSVQKLTTLLMAVIAVWALFVSHAADATTYDLAYGGRLAEPNGEPTEGPVDITFRFYDHPTAGTELHSTSPVRVSLQDGVFQTSIPLLNGDIEKIFGDLSREVYVEVEARGTRYPRQRFNFVPFALRVPVDGTTLSYNTAGKLTVIKDFTSAVTSVAGRSGAISLTTDDLPEGSDSSRRYFSASLARSALTSEAPIVYNQAEGKFSLSFTPLNKSGDTMGGTLNMGSQRIINWRY